MPVLYKLYIKEKKTETPPGAKPRAWSMEEWGIIYKCI